MGHQNAYRFAYKYGIQVPLNLDRIILLLSTKNTPD